MKQLLVALALGMMALPAQALDRADFLGAAQLSRTGSSKVIRTPACRQGERTDAIRIAVRNQPAYIDQVAVQFRNGNVQRFNVRSEFPRNSRTRWIDLNGNGRCITAIQVVGQSTNILAKATVEFYGRVRNNGGGWPGGGFPEDDYEDDYND